MQLWTWKKDYIQTLEFKKHRPCLNMNLSKVYAAVTWWAGHIRYCQEVDILYMIKIGRACKCVCKIFSKSPISRKLQINFRTKLHKKAFQNNYLTIQLYLTDRIQRCSYIPEPIHDKNWKAFSVVGLAFCLVCVLFHFAQWKVWFLLKRDTLKKNNKRKS